MDGSPTALAYQLPQVASSTPDTEPPQRTPLRQGRSGPYGQHGDLCVYQPAIRFRSRRMSQLARHHLLWSQTYLRSLPAIHIPGVFNQVANELSRAALPGEWRLHPQIAWSRFGVAQVDLFESPETAHCQWFYSLSEACSALMHWHTAGPRACANMRSPSEPTSTNIVQDKGGRGASSGASVARPFSQ